MLSSRPRPCHARHVDASSLLLAGLFQFGALSFLLCQLLLVVLSLFFQLWISLMFFFFLCSLKYSFLFLSSNINKSPPVVHQSNRLCFGLFCSVFFQEGSSKALSPASPHRLWVNGFCPGSSWSCCWSGWIGWLATLSHLFHFFLRWRLPPPPHRPLNTIYSHPPLSSALGVCSSAITHK